MSAPEYITVSNLIVDDIVLSDGRSFMNTLGGAGSHTLVGMRPWSDRLGFVAYCGDDVDPEHLRYLADLCVDTRGIVRRPGHRTARAWQLFEPDERRIEIFRTSIDDFHACKPRFDEIPPDYLQARGMHLQWGSPEELGDFFRRLRAVNPTAKVVCEPTFASLTGSLEANRALLSEVDLFSPDREEARALTGATTIPTIFERLLGAGARLVALRMGASGSLVAAADGTFYRVPAVPPAQLVDVTGAGNAYCGGFIAGLGRGDEPAAAAARAAASASFAIEQIGIPMFDAAKLAEAQRRHAWALERVEQSRDLGRLLPGGAD